MSEPATRVPSVTLHDGVAMPQVGFGVWQVEPRQTTEIVAVALEAGYRSIDTATAYGNEEGVGAAIATSGIPRDDLFVTTKVWNDDQGRDAAGRAFDASMGKLGLDVLDLYLIHWPADWQDQYVETWETFIELRDRGRVRSIGVSNFKVEHLERIIDETGVVPVVNQIELHPYLQQHELRSYHADHGIATEAWAPLGKGGPLLADPVVTGIAAAHDATAAQVVLRWHVQHGHVVIPKSATPARIRSNFEVMSVELTDDEVSAIDALDRGTRVGGDPDSFLRPN
jgi:diketogulonate reductase-like aldo/keto reductase